jgi:hypothetical protein
MTFDPEDLIKFITSGDNQTDNQNDNQTESKYTYIGGNTTNTKQEDTIQDIWDNSITNPHDFNLSCGATKVYSDSQPEVPEKFNAKSLEIANNKNEIRKTFIYTDDAINSQKETKNVSRHKDIVSKQVHSLKRSETFFYVVIAFIILFSILLGFLFRMR